MDDRLEPRLRILLGTSIAIGPGKAALLELIGETGSISEAGRRLGMSYRRAWLLVDDLNQCFRQPVVSAQTGGTIAESVGALLEAGAGDEIVVAATHGLLVAGAREKLKQGGVREVFVTDTVRVAADERAGLRVVSVAPLIAAAVRRSLSGGSLADLC